MVKIIKIKNKKTITSKVKKEIIHVLQEDGVILYPTDTQYGLGALISNKKSIDKIRKIKGREKKKPISILVSDKKMLSKFAEVNDKASEIINRYLPGPLTLILKSNDQKITKALGLNNKIGIRIPDIPFIQKIVKKINCPITTTSANLSSQETKNNVPDILKQLGKKSELIDLVIDAGKLKGEGSTILDITGNNIQIVRQGIFKI